EEQVQEELAPDFLSSPVREAHSLPLEVAAVTSESTVLSQVSNLVEPDGAVGTSATVKVVPETALITEEIFLSERESDTMLLDSARLAASPHYKLYGVNEPVQVSEPFEPKKATVEFLERTSVSVSKVLSNESEASLAPFDVIDTATAQTTLTALKPVTESLATMQRDQLEEKIVSEQLILEAIGQYEHEDVSMRQAEPALVPNSELMVTEVHEQTTVEETTVYEGSQQLPMEEIPAAKSADRSFVPNAELIVTEIVSEQKEREGYNVADLARDHMATTTVTPHALKSLTIQETQTTESVDRLSDVAVEKTLATCKDDNLEETIVRETLVLESIDSYTMEFSPSEKQAIPNVTPMTELIVTEVIVEQKEKDGYSVQDIAEGHVVKMLPSHTLKSVIVEEVQTSDVVGDVDQPRSTLLTATVRKEQLETQTILEQLVLEGLARLDEQQQPVHKSATANIEAISELHVTEVVTEQKEQEGYDVQQIASNYNAKEVPSHTLRSVLIEETQPIDDVKQFVETPVTSHAKPLTEDIEERIIAETVVLENVDSLEQQAQPEAKHAEKVLQSQIELHVTEVIAEQKEREGYSVSDLTVQQSAKTVTNEPFKSINVEEVVLSSATENIETKETTSTTLPREELVVTEIVCEQKESEGFDVHQIASGYSAHLIPSQILKPLAVEQVQPAEMHGEIKDQSTVSSESHALVNKSEHEQTTVQETMVYENLSEKPTDQSPEHKLANVDLQPVQELVITEVVAEQKEREGFDVHEIAKDYTAHATTAGLHKSIAIEEVLSSDALGELRSHWP
uniref:Uncharacterized protein n=1 Tax=Anopheles dirus TaxID=7168 RepID=A0A182NH80_9DIPT